MTRRLAAFCIAGLGVAASAASSLAQDAQYSPWPPPPGGPPPIYQYPPSGPPEPPPPPPYEDQGQGPPNAAQLGAPPTTQLVTPGQEGSKSVTTAAEAPLHEMNLVGQKIPPVLLEAMADPYARLTPTNCRTLSAAIDDLTLALGPDFDTPPPGSPGATESGGLGLKLMNSAAGSLLPFHGFIGYLTGANKRDEKVMRALAAGSARRAYLKGLGEARRCPEPASPRHLASAAPPIYDGPRRPKYPIR
ncbi:MAG TPA: hypothetical protein VGN38_04515 [Caulobacteraceae bacterium]|nr:hypothetical protein [Caulobacteraceae bacterium]